MSKRDKNGKVIKGRGSELSGLQSKFMERVSAEGLDNAAAIARELNYTSYYRDRKNVGTAFYRELMKLVDAESKSIEAAKGMNVNKLLAIRDMAMANGDFKVAMDAIKILNDMQGYKAPIKTENTEIKVNAVIDLSKPAGSDTEDTDYIDIE